MIPPKAAARDADKIMRSFDGLYAFYVGDMNHAADEEARNAIVRKYQEMYREELTAAFLVVYEEVHALKSEVATLTAALAGARARTGQKIRMVRSWVALHVYRPLERDPYIDAADLEVLLESLEETP
jgi:hypothetical protein